MEDSFTVAVSTLSTIEKLVIYLPNKPWNWSVISKRVALNFIDNNRILPWKWNIISQRDDLTLEYIEKWISVLDHIDLCGNKALTWEYFMTRYSRKWTVFHMSYNPNVTWEIVLNNKDLGWNWHGLSKIMPYEVIKANPTPLDGYWDYDQTNFTFEQYISLGITNFTEAIMRAISKTASLDIIMKNTELYWNWDIISSREDIPLLDLLAAKNFVGMTHYIAMRKDLTCEIIDKHKYILDSYTIISNLNIPIRYIQQNATSKYISELFGTRPDFNLRAFEILGMPQISNCRYSWYRAKQLLRYNFGELISANPSLTDEIVRDNQELMTSNGKIRVSWDYEVLSNNLFEENECIIHIRQLVANQFKRYCIGIPQDIINSY